MKFGKYKNMKLKKVYRSLKKGGPEILIKLNK